MNLIKRALLTKIEFRVRQLEFLAPLPLDISLARATLRELFAINDAIRELLSAMNAENEMRILALQRGSRVAWF